MYLTTV